MQKIFFILLFIVSLSAYSQETVFPLTGNKILQNAQAGRQLSHSNARTQALSLPFADDFSKPGIYPDSSKWLDSYVFINTTMADQPVTIGVATFDGLNFNGIPYDTVSGATDTADFLTSQPIDLNYAGDTTIWLSFFYQPQGLADKPESADSLVLQYLGPSGEWFSVWSRAGRSDTAFQQVFLSIRDTLLYSNFQFRFLNYATINGNRDHWHIDYVELNRNRTGNDPVFEIGLVNPIKSYLKEFSSMPWSHYKTYLNNGNFPVRDTVIDTARFFTFTGFPSAAMRSIVTDETNTQTFQQLADPTTVNVVANTDTAFTFTPDETAFPVNSNKYADFYVKHYISSANAGIEDNDTSYLTQRFQNYYAYDDGTAELAYGIPELFSRIAYRFDVKQQDTLRGIRFYFNWVGPNEHNRLFTLCYWTNIGFGTGTDQLVYAQINQKPYNIDTINGFVNYLFDTLLVVPAGPMYVGWIQNTDSLISIGLDKNTTATQNMFAYYQGLWHQSAIQGAWMMRPVFGDSLDATYIGYNEITQQRNITVFPNPVSGILSFNLDLKEGQKINVSIADAAGRMVLHKSLTNQSVDVSVLNAGIYSIVFSNEKNEILGRSRFVRVE